MHFLCKTVPTLYTSSIESEVTIEMRPCQLVFFIMIRRSFQCNNKEGTSEDRDMERAGHMEGLDIYHSQKLQNVDFKPHQHQPSLQLQEPHCLPVTASRCSVSWTPATPLRSLKMTRTETTTSTRCDPSPSWTAWCATRSATDPPGIPATHTSPTATRCLCTQCSWCQDW